MRALRRHLPVPLFIAATIFSAGASAHFVAAPAIHSTVQVADQICPAGTNWDNGLRICR